jgi:hypothetical protein
MIWNIVRVVFALVLIVIIYRIYSEREPDIPVVQNPPQKEENFHGEYRIDKNKTLTVDHYNSQLIIGLSYEF